MQTNRFYAGLIGRIATLVLLLFPFFIGCGTNKFEQEVTIETSAVKFAKEVASGQYEVLTTADVQKLIDAKTPMVLVDAMPAASSFDAAHLPGAVNFEFPKTTIKSWDDETMPGRTQVQYETLLGDDKDVLVVVYCGFVKCARSHNAAIYAQQLGYTNVKRYAGGIYAWKGSGLPVESK